MTFKMAAITWWGSHGFCYDTLHGKNNRLLFFVLVMFFVFVLGIVSINLCTMHFPDHFWPDLIIPYYSHKNSYFGKNISSKTEVINDRVY